LFDCYRTQQRVLKLFAIDVERFRSAPRYDFLQPPHPGRLHYEELNWGITGDRWRQVAAGALTDLEIA
jgi:hypothetical protein